MTERQDAMSPLHTGFAIAWLAWAVVTIAVLWWVPRMPWLDRGLIGALAGLELAAVVTKRKVRSGGGMVFARDTLSEVSTWVARMSKPGAKWYQSWNAVVVLLAFHVSYLLGRQALALEVGVPVFLGMLGFLLWHWLWPDRVG